MSLTVKTPTIEGMPSPAARAARSQDGAAAPQMRLDVMRSLRKRPKLAAWVGGGVFLLAFLFGLLRKPAYQAESLIYIEPLASKVLSDGTAGSYDAGRYDSYFQQQMQTAVRPDILSSAIESLPPFVWQRGGESMQSAVTRLQNTLKVQRVLTSYQLSISMVYASPQAAAAVVNAVTNAYLEQGRKDEHAVIDQRLKLLGEERQRIQLQLGEDRVEQASLGGVLGLANPTGPTVSPFDAQVAGVETQVAGARQARDMAAAQYAVVQGANSPALAAAAEEQMATDSGLNSMKQTISQRKAQLSTQMAGLTPSNPIYKQDQAEIEDLDRSLDAMTLQVREKAERRLQDKLRADLQRASDVEGRLNAQLRQQTATATGALPKLQRAQELNSDITRLTARFSFVDDAMRSLELESNGPGSAHLSVAAQVPVSPEPSKRKLILALSLPLGCFAGLFAVVFAHRMDPRIYSAPDVERVLGFSPIGVLPAVSEVSGRTMEEYTLRLAAGLQSAYRVSSAQSFVFTAASASTETSGFVHEIARVLGTLGFKALVMDAASVLNTANRTQPAAARGGLSYRSAALVRTIEGTRQGYAAEELERLKLKYDLLLIDAPPLLTSAEAEYLVRCADATILIAQSGITVKTELYQSALLLQHLNVAGVGAVLQELHLRDAEPAFRAAIEAVERLQQGRMDRLQPAVQAAPEAFDESAEAAPAVDSAVLYSEPLAAAAPAETVVQHEAVTLPAVAEPTVEAAAPALMPEVLVPEPLAVPAPVLVAEQDAMEEPEQVRPWRELLKKTPEPVEEFTPEPVVTPVVPRQAEVVAGDETEPVIYFQDRLRPRKVVEPVREAVGASEDRGTIHVESVPVYVEPVELVREPEPVVPVMTAPVESFEPMPEPLDAAGAFERTVFESGTEGHGQAVAAPEVEEFARAYFAEPATEVGAQPERFVETEDEGAEEPLKGLVEAEDAHAVPQLLEPVAQAPAAVAPAPPVARREPTPPKMGWFTLKFRGTSERVLRIIPGEEGDEYEPAEEPVSTEVASSQVAEVLHDATPAEPEPIMEQYEESELAVHEAHEVVRAEDEPVAAQGEPEPWDAGVYAVSAPEAEAVQPVEEGVVSAEEDEGVAIHPAGIAEPVAQSWEERQIDEEAQPSVTPVAETVMEQPAFDEADEAVEQSEPVYSRQPEIEAVREDIAEPVPELHTPVKMRWTVRDLHQDELEQELKEAHSAPEAPAPAERFAPATLMNELRSRAASMPARDESSVQKHPSGRRSGAPVEERLEPRAASLTRRWEMLSRFDAAADLGSGAEAEPPQAAN